MITLSNIAVQFGKRVLYKDVNMKFTSGNIYGVIGANGAGKSTILKLICGHQNPTSGKVAVPSGIKIGYLPQIMEHHRGRSVIDEAMTAFAEMFDLEAELEKITVELSEREDYESQAYQDLIIRMNEVNDRLAYTRSDNPQVLAEKTLIGLGFKYEELQRPTETFSQGWNMRIELAKILLSKPDVLLLDEPTNHLDIESIEWLEGYLGRQCITLLMVTHDRYFLDRVCNEIIEIGAVYVENGKPIKKFNQLVRPNEEISEYITSITGIDYEMVKDVLPPILYTAVQTQLHA